MNLEEQAAPSPRPVFEARGLTKIYQMGEVQVQALRGVDLDLYTGEFVVLLGQRQVNSAQYPRRPGQSQQRYGALRRS
jgi:hypothetical protein